MKRIWIDLDNSPHVPLFRPVIEEFGKKGVECVITARDFAQTAQLLEFWGIPHTVIGKHGGKNKVGKVINLFERAGQLRKYMKGREIDIALSHGSRTQLVAAKFMGIESVLMMDYEYTEATIFKLFSDHILIPEYIPDERLGSVRIPLKKVMRYPGFKEELYLNDFSPEQGLREKLGIGVDRILVTIRPPAMEGNYHDSLSEHILIKILERLTGHDKAYPLVVRRTDMDGEFLRERFDGRIHFLPHAVDGRQLIWTSDIFISGGGSMNREAALLGVPTYSIFTGRKPYLDEHLAGQGKLTFIDTMEKVDLLEIRKREIPGGYTSDNPGLAERVADIILSIGH
jgi:predicted glycosyltransferase